jgi:aspartyl-tRNA(Asn)/glutamyl-tRNA(Gln) amidotransferase subunit A
MDVKVITAATEIYSINYRDLVSRPGDFGRDFLGRVLPACLFQAADYVAASREHRRIIAEARSLYGKYDVLLTAGFGPAPRLDGHRTANFWRRTCSTPSNVTAGPRWSCATVQPDRAPARHADHRPAVRQGDRVEASHAYERATA